MWGCDTSFSSGESAGSVDLFLRLSSALLVELDANPDPRWYRDNPDPSAVLGDANEVLKAIHKLKRRAYLCAASAPAVAGGARA